MVINMANKGILSKNYYIVPEAVADLGAEVYNMMAEADQAMAEASEIIAEIASLTERVPSQIRCGALLDACESAQAEIKSVDFLSYGQKVEQGLQNLLDHNQYITEHFIKNMETHTEKMRGLGEEFRRLSELITYSGEDVQLKGVTFSTVNNTEAENTDDGEENTSGRRWDETSFCVGAAEVLEVELDESIIARVDEIKEREKILLKYLIEQGITIPNQQRGVLRLIRTERSDILESLFIMECKGEEKDEVLEAAMEYCYGAAEKVFIEYMSQNGIDDPAAHMIVLDRIRDTNPQLLLNLIAENCDSDKEAEGLLEYYYSLQEGMTFSLERYDDLRGLELADYHLNGTTKDPGGAGVYNDEGELIGIKPYYVMVNVAGGGFKDDGGITFGIGHNISEAEWTTESDREHQLLSGYIPQNSIITGIEVGSLPGCKLVIVPGSTMVPIEEVNRIFYEDIQEFSDKVANTLISQGIDVTQDEFDALVIYAYNRGSLTSDMLNNLKNGNRNPTDWQDLWSGGDNREEYCQNLFFSITN